MISDSDILVVCLTIELTKRGLINQLDLGVTKDLVAWFDQNTEKLVEWRDLQVEFEEIIKNLPDS